MQIIYRHVNKITLRDQDREFELPIESFTEYDDDIRITSSIRETFLQRGWVGDLTYETDDGIDIREDCDAHKTEETFHNVLLKNVLLTVDRHSACNWEYIILKK
jgi:hypothetical protein